MTDDAKGATAPATSPFLYDRTLPKTEAEKRLWLQLEKFLCSAVASLMAGHEGAVLAKAQGAGQMADLIQFQRESSDD